MIMSPEQWRTTLKPRFAGLIAELENAEHALVLTGAGMSAESGIPTFRGPEGYWTVGSDVYHPQEMATLAMFGRNPDAVWQWYLYRATVCRAAAPNAGHLALVEGPESMPAELVVELS